MISIPVIGVLVKNKKRKILKTKYLKKNYLEILQLPAGQRTEECLYIVQPNHFAVVQLAARKCKTFLQAHSI